MGAPRLAAYVVLICAAVSLHPQKLAAQDEYRGKAKGGFEKGSFAKGGFEKGGFKKGVFGSGEPVADGSELANLKGGVGRVPKPAIDDEMHCAIGRTKGCDIKLAIARGLFETGLKTRFPAGAICPEIDEQYAISYTHKRGRENYHGGIDMPAQTGTPIVASAAGVVVAKYGGERSFRGIEIVLRHSPDDTGIPLWIYTAYSHFDSMPAKEVGQVARMGEILGPTGNTGRGAVGLKGVRRPAIHFAVFFSTKESFFVGKDSVIPANGHWMDPVALFRNQLPLDSYTLKALPRPEKQIPIPVMFTSGTTFPADTKIIWPYLCKRK